MLISILIVELVLTHCETESECDYQTDHKLQGIHFRHASLDG